jgi:hypothetical protein
VEESQKSTILSRHYSQALGKESTTTTGHSTAIAAI